MGLKLDIYDALVKNLGKEHIKNSSSGQKKVDVLADDLRNAIVNWVKAQTFQITDMEAPVKIPELGIQTQVNTTVVGTTAPGGGPLLPGSIGTGTGLNQKPAFGLAQISDKGSKVDGRVGPAVTTSEVKLLSSTKD